MSNNRQRILTRLFMLALVAFLALPAIALAQGNSKNKRNKDVFVNGHDARDGRWDKNDSDRRRRDRNNDEEWRRRNRRNNDDWRRNDDAWRRSNDDWRRRNNGGYGNGGYGNGGYGNGGYGGYNTTQLRQTALNAGYNNGIREGRKDRNNGDRFDYRDEGAYQDATRDYNSRLGDRELYRRYFRQGFQNGYTDAFRGY